MKSVGAKCSVVRFGQASHVLNVALVGLGLFIGVVFIPGSQAVPVPAVPQFAESGGSERYLTHVATDKPVYRTGEKLYVRGAVLRADGHIPDAAGTANFEIQGPKGETVDSGVAGIVDSIVGFSWDVPAGQAGGEYTVRITHPVTGYAPGERKFDIRAY